ncbi:MAG: hypothetical protein JW976_13875 [Syntrophaceae bacterium]|nr:hypothetical protein [Syntrophaceae bacterium]
MGKLIKKFSDGSTLEYDWGIFDDWCVYLTKAGAMRYAPKDVEYFTRLHQLSSSHSAKKIYEDFVEVYNRTTKKIDNAVLALITDISRKYGSDELEVDVLLSIIYAGMVAEENKENAILGKRIKRLGMHQVLIQNITPATAAHFSKGKKWRVLDVECKNRGF